MKEILSVETYPVPYLYPRLFNLSFLVAYGLIKEETGSRTLT